MYFCQPARLYFLFLIPRSVALSWLGPGVREGGEQQQRRQSHDMKYWPSCSTTAFGEAKKLRRKSKKIFDKSMKIKENIIKIRENQRQHSQDLNYWPGKISPCISSIIIFVSKHLHKKSSNTSFINLNTTTITIIDRTAAWLLPWSIRYQHYQNYQHDRQ